MLVRKSWQLSHLTDGACARSREKLLAAPGEKRAAFRLLTLARTLAAVFAKRAAGLDDTGCLACADGYAWLGSGML